MIEPLYTLRDVDVPVGARTRVRARIEEELARGALPKRHVGRYALAAAVAAAVIAFVAWPRPPASSHAVVVPAGTQMDFAVATGHSVVHGPAQVGLEAGGLTLASGRVDAQGKLRVRGPSCDVMVDGTAEVSVTDAKLTVRVFAGSVEIVPPVVTCERIDLTPPAVKPAPAKAGPATPSPASMPPTTVTPPTPATITASTSPVGTPPPASTSASIAAPRAETIGSVAAPRATASASNAAPRAAATSIAAADTASPRHAPTAAPHPAATAAPRDSATKVARVESTPTSPHAAPAVPSLERIDPPPPPLPHAESAAKITPPPAPPPVARASTLPVSSASTPPVASTQRATTTSAPTVPASSLAAEELAAALAEYRTAKALETSDPEAAVRAWQAWRAHRSNTPLAHGADLRLLALLHTLHRDGEAAALARDFLQRYPNSPRRADVKRMIEGAR